MSESLITQAPHVVPEFKGTKDQQALARRVYEAMVLYGAFFSYEAPIRQTLENLAAFLASQDGGEAEALAPAIEQALQQNPEVFLREEHEGTVIFATSKAGRYIPPYFDQMHTFAQRLYEPEKPLPVDDLSVVITTNRPSLTTVEPVYISDYWRGQVGGGPLVSSEDATLDEEEQPEELEVAPTAVEEAEAAPEVAAPAAPAPAPEPAAPVAAGTFLVLDDGTQVDMRQPADALMAQHGAALIGAVRRGLEQDPLRRIIAFGHDYYPEDLVASFSKGDYRRIREYILEQGEPLLDTAILADLFNRTPRDRDYESFRFALNYRLNREKDFEFVGVEGARLWSTKGLATIGTKRLKASETGQLFAFLEEGQDDSLGTASAESIAAERQVTRFLTFFEREFGVLPLDAAMKALMPPALLPEQRSAVVHFEAPQHYTRYLGELRYPTGNRGGWIHGLEDFFREFLVPGAMITIAATEEPHIFTIQYEETAGEEAKVLNLDEKKGRYAFAPQTFYCAIDSDLITSQERLTRLRNMKLLTPGERRRLELTLAHVCETVGIQKGDGYQIALEDLYLATNVQRPASRTAILQTLESDGRFEQAGDLWVYHPLPEEAEEADADEDEE